jgi:hypothetical protein
VTDSTLEHESSARAAIAVCGAIEGTLGQRLLGFLSAEIEIKMM